MKIPTSAFTLVEILLSLGLIGVIASAALFQGVGAFQKEISSVNDREVDLLNLVRQGKVYRHLPPL